MNHQAKLTFYAHPMSRSRITRWMLEETGLPYDTVLLDYGTSMKAPEYLAINPMGKVPALRHGDTVVTENVAICMYLADLVPERRLAPPVGSPERGAYYRWLLFIAGPLEALLTARMAGPLAPARMAGYGEDGQALDVLEAALEGREHLAGVHFTAADLLAASVLGYYVEVGAIPPRPAFSAFVQRHADRPAALRATQIDDELVDAAPETRVHS
ncbi:MAG TPA: glutathione S-transferase family protein [Rubrivivax sp.]|nr:glutathione S-transferase family protein [Rubrivivax sp.]